MEINKTQEGASVKLALVGRLDTMTAKKLEAQLPSLADEKALTLDFKELEYVSSAGLRVLLALQQQADDNGGTLRIVNVCEDITEVFEMTGFSDVLTIE